MVLLQFPLTIDAFKYVFRDAIIFSYLMLSKKTTLTSLHQRHDRVTFTTLDTKSKASGLYRKMHKNFLPLFRSLSSIKYLAAMI
uniref:Uncharacterized protein n=1 Tax=Anguilla anguilla TaxID=7936 RepID=A0A0E9XCK9_ANGAN